MRNFSYPCRAFSAARSISPKTARASSIYRDSYASFSTSTTTHSRRPRRLSLISPIMASGRHTHAFLRRKRLLSESLSTGSRSLLRSARHCAPNTTPATANTSAAASAPAIHSPPDRACHTVSPAKRAAQEQRTAKTIVFFFLSGRISRAITRESSNILTLYHRNARLSIRSVRPFPTKFNLLFTIISLTS